MKVKNLVEQLLKEDQEATVIKTSDKFELNNADIEANGIVIYTHAKKVKKTFTDAFDYENYSKDVWEVLADDGKETVIKII